MQHAKLTNHSARTAISSSKRAKFDFKPIKFYNPQTLPECTRHITAKKTHTAISVYLKKITKIYKNNVEAFSIENRIILQTCFYLFIFFINLVNSPRILTFWVMSTLESPCGGQITSSTPFI